MTQHTPTPWKLWNGYGPLRDGQYAVARIGPDTGERSDGLVGSEGHDIIGTKADLEYVVLACNSHDALLAAAKAGLAALYTAQGEWADVLPPYAPEWTYPLKDTAEDMEAAIKQAKEGAA